MLITAHYCQLLPLMSIFSLFIFDSGNASITISLLPHYCLQSSIPAITAHYFHLITSHYFHYFPILPHSAVLLAPLLHHYYLITPELWFRCPLVLITSTFSSSNGSNTASLLPHYYIQSIITAITAHYFHLITSHYFSLLPLLPIDSTLRGTLAPYCNSGTLLPLLPITSTSLLLITTKSVFFITHY
jgi:hypothetical protein